MFPLQTPAFLSRSPLPATSSVKTVKTVLAEAEAQLRARGIDTPRLDAEALLAHTLATDRAHLFTHLSSWLTDAEQQAFQCRLERRARREPLAYITGEREFWSLDFRVTSDVLIPRPETELLVETTLRLIAQKNAEPSTLNVSNSNSALRCRVPAPLADDAMQFSHSVIASAAKQALFSRDYFVANAPRTDISSPNLMQLPPRGRRAEEFASHLTILDVGTGSGCIAISLAKELPAAELWALDISPTALAIALENARRHEVANRIRFLQSDLFAALNKGSQSFDFIVANPPYIAHPDLSALQPEVRDWEPRAALDGGKDGLDFHRRLIQESPAHLRPGGWLVMELGAGQGPAVRRFIQTQKNFQESFSVQDYAGFERVSAARGCV